MQHNRFTMLSSSETCHLGSSSNNQVIDQQSLLASNPNVDEHNLLPDTLESENYPHYVLNSHEVGMPSGSMIGQQNTSLSLWDSAGSSTMGFLGDHDSLLQAKREHFAPSLSIGGPLIIEGRRRESSSSLPSHLNIDLNLNQADQFEIGNVDMVHSSGQSGMDGFPLNRGLSTTEHVLRREFSPGVIRSSSHTGNLFDDTAGQETGGSSSHTVNHFRSSIKRKNIAGSHAESSAHGSSRNRQQNNNVLLSSPSSPESTDSLSMPASTNYGFSFPPIEQLNQNTDTSADAIFPSPYTLSGHLHESERFMRNTRMRISANEYDESLPNLLHEGSFRCSARQPAHQQSSFTPVQPRATSSSASSHNRPHVPAVAQFSESLYQPPSNGNFGSRTGSSSSSTDTINLRSASQDPGRSMTRSNLHESFLLGPSIFTADSTNLLSAPGSRSNQQNSSSSSTLRAAANVGLQQVPGLNVPQPSSAARGSTDIPRRSSLAASASLSRSSSIALQHRGHSSSSHEIRSHQPGSSSRATPQHYSRAVPPSIDRQNPGYLDLQSFMQTIAASREGSRSVTELRNVFEQLRQGRSAARLEEFLADRSLIRRASLIDRHREMRLDVDNMSYEVEASDCNWAWRPAASGSSWGLRPARRDAARGCGRQRAAPARIAAVGERLQLELRRSARAAGGDCGVRRAAGDLSGAVVNDGSIRLAGGAVVPSAVVGIRAASPELPGGLRREDGAAASRCASDGRAAGGLGGQSGGLVVIDRLDWRRHGRLAVIGGIMVGLPSSAATAA